MKCLSEYQHSDIWHLRAPDASYVKHDSTKEGPVESPALAHEKEKGQR